MIQRLFRQDTLFLVLIGLGVLLRLWQFGDVPVSLNRDEAALGYNAFAIASEGTDEWGNRYPLMFESFGDYKLPGYIYSLSAIVRLIDVNNAVIRIPSLIAGLVIIGMTYLIAKEMYGSKRLSLAAAAVVSLAPWSIFYSRMAWEANVALMWLLLGLWILLRSQRWWSSLVFGASYLLAVLHYNAPLLLAPVLIGFILLQLKLSWKTRAIYIVVVLGIGALMAYNLQSVSAQKSAITILQDPQILLDHQRNYTESTTIIGRVRYNRYVDLGVHGLSRFVNSFGPKFLAIQGGSHPWHSLTNAGQIYWTVLGAFVLSLIVMIGRSLRRSRWMWAWLWLLFGSLLPSIITLDAPHATRSLLFFWMIGLIGVYALKQYKKLGWVLIVGLIIETSIFSYKYFVQFPTMMPGSWPTGLEAAIVSADEIASDRPVVISTAEAGGLENIRSDFIYIYPLLYSETLPSDFLATVRLLPRANLNLIQVAGFGRYAFLNSNEDWPEGAVLILRQQDGSYRLE